MNGLQSAITKLNQNIETVYNDNFVNFYLNLESNSKNSKKILIQRESPRHWNKRSIKFSSMEVDRN